MIEEIKNPATAKTDRSGRIKITELPRVVNISDELFRNLVDVWNAAINLKQAQGRYHTERASVALYELLPKE